MNDEDVIFELQGKLTAIEAIWVELGKVLYGAEFLTNYTTSPTTADLTNGFGYKEELK